jgi:hypothetical protein
MLTQHEADALIAMRKFFLTASAISLPPGTDETYELLGDDKRERFLLDIWRGTLRLSKLRYQTRGRAVIVLVRLDVDGAPHTNPDGTRIDGFHIHLYREGYEDKWAYPLDPSVFRDVTDIRRALEDFCRYCNVDNVPPLQGDLL